MSGDADDAKRSKLAPNFGRATESDAAERKAMIRVLRRVKRHQEWMWPDRFCPQIRVSVIRKAWIDDTINEIKRGEWPKGECDAG